MEQVEAFSQHHEVVTRSHNDAGSCVSARVRERVESRLRIPNVPNLDMIFLYFDLARLGCSLQAAPGRLIGCKKGSNVALQPCPAKG